MFADAETEGGGGGVAGSCIYVHKNAGKHGRVFNFTRKYIYIFVVEGPELEMQLLKN